MAIQFHGRVIGDLIAADDADRVIWSRNYFDLLLTDNNGRECCHGGSADQSALADIILQPIRVLSKGGQPITGLVMHLCREK